jgi:hypothetical protein
MAPSPCRSKWGQRVGAAATSRQHCGAVITDTETMANGSAKSWHAYAHRRSPRRRASRAPAAVAMVAFTRRPICLMATCARLVFAVLRTSERARVNANTRNAVRTNSVTREFAPHPGPYAVLKPLMAASSS